MMYRIFIFVLIISIFSSSCSMNNSERLSPSGINSVFDFDTSKSFETYISHSRNIIDKGRVNVDNDLPEKETILSWNYPFILNKPSKCSTKESKGILLSHGLSDSPALVRSMAKFFNENCFTVYTILLTGHGTRPGDLLNVSYKDWIRQFEYGVKELSKQVDKIYLGGISLGGALAFHYAISNPSTEIEAIIGLSPALKFGKKTALAVVLRYFRRYLKIYDDVDLIKYESFATNAVAQIFFLSREIRKKLHENSESLKDIKVFAALSYEDRTIDLNRTLETLLDYTSPSNRYILLYHQNNLNDNIIKQDNLYPMLSSIKKDNILSSAHISLFVDENNIWYGRNGKYRNCLYYFNRKKDYAQCKTGKNPLRGEITRDNLRKGILTRLTYNPFMDSLFTELSRYLGLHSI